MAKDERTITDQDVWEEHLGEVNVPLHWAYLVGVIVGAFLLMLGLLSLLGAGGSA
ncbi:MAG TPA: hypothetical protein VFZ12_06095 [Dehalococcoidia bacterium]|nr:hypothetical protein [Dehalococcoidia bacterium]